MNQKRENFGITYDNTNREVYVFGGYYNGFLSHSEKYSVELDEWTELAPMTNKKDMASACILNNQFIFIIGGHIGSSNSLNEIEKYSIKHNSWHTIHILGHI